MIQMHSERRVAYGAWLEMPDGEECGPSFYLAHSLGPSGLCLLSDDPPGVGRSVQLRLLVENEPRVMSAEGEVVRHQSGEGRNRFAVRFTNLDSGNRDFITQLFSDDVP